MKSKEVKENILNKINCLLENINLQYTYNEELANVIETLARTYTFLKNEEE